MDGDLPFLAVDEVLLPGAIVAVHSEGSAGEAESLVDALLHQSLAIGICLVAAAGAYSLVEVYADGYLVEYLQEQVREEIEHRLAGFLVTGGIDAGMVFTPLAYAPGAHPVQFVRIVELLREGTEKLLVALLEDGIIGVRGPDFGGSRCGLEALGTLGFNVIRAGVHVKVPAVGTELENQLQTALAGAFAKHAETLCRFGVTGGIPEIKSLLRLGLAPVRADQQGIGIVRNPDVADLGREVVVDFPEVVGKAVSQAGIDYPAVERVAVHCSAVGRNADRCILGRLGIVPAATAFLAAGCQCDGSQGDRGYCSEKSHCILGFCKHLMQNPSKPHRVQKQM